MPEPETYGFPDPFQYTSVADLAHPGYAAGDLRRLTGDLPRDDESWPLEPGPLPLYVCPIDGDLACGAVTVAVTHGRNETTWSDFRLEDGYTDDEIGLDLSALGPSPSPAPPTAKPCSNPSASRRPRRPRRQRSSGRARVPGPRPTRTLETASPALSQEPPHNYRCPQVVR